MSFDAWEYTRDSIIKQLSLIELHGKDGSAVESGCDCISNKHIHIIEGLSEEAVGFAKSEEEKRFYSELSAFCREMRKRIDSEDWTAPSSHSCPPCPKCGEHKH